MDQNRHFQPAVYMVANHRNGTIYTGVTSNLPQRAWQHREGLIEGFPDNMAASGWFGSNFIRPWNMRSPARSR